jgi:two-component system cell cycle response regulator
MERVSRVLVVATLVMVGLMAVELVTGVPVPAVLAPAWHWRLEIVELAAAATCTLCAVRRPGERTAWALLALGMVASALGDVYTDTVLAHDAAPPFPSWADALYLSFYPAFFAGIALLVRARGGRFPLGTWLDGGIAAVGAVSIVGALVFPVVIDTSGGATLAVATDIAYPIGDTVLLGLIVCAVAMRGWRPGRAWLLFAAGILVWSIGDIFFLYESIAGTYVRGTFIDLTYALALALVATSSRQPPLRATNVTTVGWATLLMPSIFGTASLALALWDHFRRVETLAVLLAGVTLALVLVRLALTFTAYTRALAASRDEAISDPLTGLGNRRALASDLERLLRPGAPRSTVILFDLNGFKGFNDTYGHPAGDALLQRLAHNLVAAPHGGRVYRMGGDEFCVLAPLGARDASDVAGLAARALAERGELYEITSAYGAVVLPDETSSLSEAMRLADERLYLQKGEGRRSQTGQAIDTLVRVMEARGDEFEAHGASIAELARGLAIACSLPEAEREQIGRAAMLHDLGKVALPDAVLEHPGPLDPAERGVMRRHPEIGQHILGDSPALAPIGLLVRASHENWDGTGYPDGLAGFEIPLGARIVAICDAYGELTGELGPHPTIGLDAAVRELRHGAGTHFDPALVEAFVTLIDHRRALRTRPVAA